MIVPHASLFSTHRKPWFFVKQNLDNSQFNSQGLAWNELMIQSNAIPVFLFPSFRYDLLDLITIIIVIISYYIFIINLFYNLGLQYNYNIPLSAYSLQTLSYASLCSLSNPWPLFSLTIVTYIYNTTLTPKARGSLQYMMWEDCKSRGIREFSVRLCLLRMSKATSIKSDQHDCLNLR